jgi:preprotein translocase SecE subunit
MSITTYLKETRAEFKHVTWPKKQTAISYAVAVIVISLFTAYFLGLFDTIFQMGIGKLLGF